MSFGHEIWQRNKIDQLGKKNFDIKVANQIPVTIGENIENILSQLPDQIFEHNELVEFIHDQIGISDPNLIEEAINLLVQQKKIARVEEQGMLFYKRIDSAGLNNNKLPSQSNQNNQQQQGQNQRFNKL